MKRLKLNQLNKQQLSSLEEKRNSCIVLNDENIPSFEFYTYTGEDINYLSVTDDKKETILPWSEAVRLKDYLNKTTPIFDDDSEDIYEYVKTIYMDFDERREWEKNENGIVIDSCFNEGVLELSKSYSYTVDDNLNRIHGTEKPGLCIAMLGDNGYDEASVFISNKDQVRRLRNYLNNYLEDNFE